MGGGSLLQRVVGELVVWMLMVIFEGVCERLVLQRKQCLNIIHEGHEVGEMLTGTLLS